MAARTGKAVSALRREERGFTLIELLIATGLGLLVIGGALTVFIGGVRSEPRTASKAAALEEARVAVDRITRELRQGLEMPTTSASELAIVTYVKAATCGGAGASSSIPCRVTYRCSGETCSRVVAQPNGSAPGPEVQIVSGLRSPDVFTYTGGPPPAYVGVSLALATSGEPITLKDGVALRNTTEEP